jgi:hypothetical protein
VSYELIDQNKIKVSLARRALTPEQIALAEWLALPKSERVPANKKGFAEALGLNPQTISNWCNIPEVWTVRDEFLREIGKDLVPEAIRALRRSLQSNDSKVVIQAAKDILDRWSEPRRTASIVASITDMYKQAQNPKITDA